MPVPERNVVTQVDPLTVVVSVNVPVLVRAQSESVTALGVFADTGGEITGIRAKTTALARIRCALRWIIFMVTCYRGIYRQESPYFRE